MPGMLNLDRDPYFYGRLRHRMAPADPMHSVVAPLEHREFTRETVGRNPWMAVPLAGAIPEYSWLKFLAQQRPGALPALAMPIMAARAAMPRKPNTSPASWDEIFAGYEGLFQGLQDKARR